MTDKKTKRVDIKAMPLDVYKIVLLEQNKMRLEKGRHVSIDAVICHIIKSNKPKNNG